MSASPDYERGDAYCVRLPIRATKCIVGEQIYPDVVEMPERGMAPVLQIGRMSVPAEIDAEWNAGTVGNMCQATARCRE
jgi:hypothetical protein